MDKLVSVIINSYRKFQFIYEAIDSVLCQSYGAVELLISDDGSEDFPEEKIREYIEKKKGDNVCSVLIHHEQKNVGTVRHLNHAVPLVHGEYIGLMAADDAYYDEHVLERFVSGFESMDPQEECYVEFAQTAMCDYSLKRIDGYALFENVREAVERGGSGLFDLVAYCACLPTTSFFYKKEFFQKYGEFDEDFYLVEDYPMHCRIVREGWKIHYEHFVAARHRSGGISHGNVGGLSKTAYLYDLDILNIRKKCIKPYYRMLSKEARADARDKEWAEAKWIKSQLPLYENNRKLQRQYLWEFRWSIRKDRLAGSRYQFKALAVKLVMYALVLLAVIPEAGSFIPLTAAFMSGVYRFGWVLLALGILCRAVGALGNMIVRIESFPGDICRF